MSCTPDIAVGYNDKKITATLTFGSDVTIDDGYVVSDGLIAFENLYSCDDDKGKHVLIQSITFKEFAPTGQVPANKQATLYLYNESFTPIAQDAEFKVQSADEGDALVAVYEVPTRTYPKASDRFAYSRCTSWDASVSGTALVKLADTGLSLYGCLVNRAGSSWTIKAGTHMILEMTYTLR